MRPLLSATSTPLAHVLGGGTAWWADALLLTVAAGGAAYAIAVREWRLRRWGVGAAVAGLVAFVALGAALPGPPPSPGYRLLLMTPPGDTLASPVALRLCAWYPSGLAAAVPGPNEVLSVSVDGSERIPAATSSTVAVDVPDGSHILGVEVLTKGHVVYSPRLRVERAVTVHGRAPLGQPAPCPAQPPTPTPRPSP